MTNSINSLEKIPVDGAELDGKLTIPDNAEGLVVFAHGTGSSRISPRNNYLAETFRKRGSGTLLLDLLTEEEDQTRENRFDIPLLVKRLVSVTDWIKNRPEIGDLSLGYFGASTGAAAALLAVTETDCNIQVLVSRGGRVDMASDGLNRVRASTLFIVGGDDSRILEWNRIAFEKLQCEHKQFEIIAEAGHLFKGPGELEKVVEVAGDWFGRHL